MTRALDIITSAYQRCNRLSPGETLSADDAAFGFGRLADLVDEMAGQTLFLYKTLLTSATQSGHITLGAGSWAAIAPGDEVVSATANNLAMAPITVQQFNEIYQPTVTGVPTVWAQDGFSTVYLWPVPTGQTIKLMTRSGVAAFADQTTDYAMPDGYKAALSAALAVRIAPNIIGGATPDLLRAEKVCMGAIDKYDPAIINAASYTSGKMYFPPRLF